MSRKLCEGHSSDSLQHTDPRLHLGEQGRNLQLSLQKALPPLPHPATDCKRSRAGYALEIQVSVVTMIFFKKMISYLKMFYIEFRAVRCCKKERKEGLPTCDESSLSAFIIPAVLIFSLFL